MIRRFWASLNYRYCMSAAYLAEHRGDKFEAADWACRAMHWQGEIEHIDIERRFSC